MRLVHVLPALLVVLSVATPARADGPRYSSDGIYVGARVTPGVALYVAYDLDVYLDAGRRFSLGPGVGATFFGAEADVGQQQDYSIEVDPLRFKAQPTVGGHIRPFGLVTAGFLYARYPMPPAAAADEWAATLAVGGGADFWIEDHFALDVLLTSRFRLSASDALPIAWVELAVGGRFGM
jgi:hypothetical protein